MLFLRALRGFFSLFLLFRLLLRFLLRLKALLLKLFQAFLFGGLFLAQFFRLLLRLFLTLLGGLFSACLLLLLAVVLLHYRTGIDHHGVDSRSAAAARRVFIDMLIERTPDQQCNEQYMQHYGNDDRAFQLIVLFGCLCHSRFPKLIALSGGGSDRLRHQADRFHASLM